MFHIWAPEAGLLEMSVLYIQFHRLVALHVICSFRFSGRNFCILKTSLCTNWTLFPDGKYCAYHVCFMSSFNFAKHQILHVIYEALLRFSRHFVWNVIGRLHVTPLQYQAIEILSIRSLVFFVQALANTLFTFEMTRWEDRNWVASYLEPVHSFLYTKLSFC